MKGELRCFYYCNTPYDDVKIVDRGEDQMPPLVPLCATCRTLHGGAQIILPIRESHKWLMENDPDYWNEWEHEHISTKPFNPCESYNYHVRGDY